MHPRFESMTSLAAAATLATLLSTTAVAGADTGIVFEIELGSAAKRA